MEAKMDTIPENVPTETTLRIDSILAVKDNDPISQIVASLEDDSAKAISKTIASKDGHVRRNSTGNIGIPYKSVKILSRYLAANPSTSCHDLCKYRTKQDFDAHMMGSQTWKATAEKHSRGHDYIGKNVILAQGKKSSSVSFPPCSPRISSPLKNLAPRSKPALSKLSALPTEDRSGSKETGTDDVLATSSSRKQTVRNSKDTTSELNQKKAPSSNLHSAKKALTRPLVSLAPKHSGMKSASPTTDKLKNLKVVAKSSTAQDLETKLEKRSKNAEGAKNKPNRNGIIRAKDQDSTARKLNFRKGKVTENQPVTNASRRLKFKQRSLSDSLVVDVKKIENKFQNREIHIQDAEINAANSESEKVALKKQDVDEDKKGAQNLLNNVIEETANKLAETKKSKVKVLVGAFETVISLKETKPAASMVDVQ